MITQTREDDLMIFSDIGEYEYDGDEDNIPLSVLIPSFMTSELKTAFTIGFLIYIPFVIIDLIVASVLMSMGMMMLSPMMISHAFQTHVICFSRRMDSHNAIVDREFRSLIN